MMKILCALLLMANAAFAQVSLNQGLVAYYPFSGSPNETTGNGVDGILNNGPTLTTDRFGNANSAYMFDGIDDYIQIPSNPTINPARQFSIALYFNTQSSSLQTILGKIGYFAGIGTQFQIAINFSLYPGILYGVNPPSNNCTGVPLNGNYVNTGAGSITSNQWYCVVATYDNAVQKIYLNGTLIQTSTAPFIDLNVCSNANVQIGSWWNGDTQRFRGKIDDIRFYNRAISAAEVNALCNYTTPIVINDYTPALALNECTNKLTVLDATRYNVDDTVLLIQMKGAFIDSANSASFGNIVDYRNAGNYEFNYVKSKAGNVIELKNVVTRQYNFLDGKVQLVSVPYYQNLNVSAELTCLPWDGSVGGVLTFNVQDSLLLNAPLDVSGKGFRGGRGLNTSNNNWFCNSPDYFYPAGSIEGAEKGEGIAEVSMAKSNGKGPLANGGGGGNQSNAGGGGGGNAGSGGKGGHQFSLCTSTQDNRGREGKNLSVINQNKIFLGGGGGSGDANNPGFDGFSSVGGNGGGIIIVKADKIIANNANSILANGAPGLDCNTGNCHEGMAGGGAGGSVLIQANSYLAMPTDIQVKGGKGADASHTASASPYEHGPGGGGAGGLTWIGQPALPSNVTVAGNGGINGVNLNFGNSSWGATPGSNGITLFNLALSVDDLLFMPNIDSVRIKDSITSCTSFDFKGLAYFRNTPIAQWQWNFGDATTANTQNTTHNYSLPGTYTVKLFVTDINGCKDSIAKVVVAAPFISTEFHYKQLVCSPLTVQFFNQSPVTNAFWDLGDNTTTTAISAVQHTYAAPGNYVVKFFTNIPGVCTDTVIKTISVAIVPDNIILTADTTICSGSSKQLQTVPALSFCWSPQTYLDDPNAANPITSAPMPITYYFNAEVQGTNLITNGNFSAGNSGFTSQYNYAASNTTEGEYFVGNSPQSWNAAVSNCSDHTTGNGNMLLVNGSPVPDVEVWTQAVNVIPNTNYAFSTWIQALYPPNPAQLKFSINGSDIGNFISASLPTCNWTRFYSTWNSGNNSTATISIVNKNTIVQGNDFALDDISFAPVMIKRDSVRINVDTPLVQASADTTVCKSVPVQLQSTGAVQYNWTPAAGLSAPNIGNPIATPAASTTYIVTGINQFGCIDSDTVEVFINPLPVIALSQNDTICTGETIQLFASGGVAYSWSPASTLSNPNIAFPIANPPATTTYQVVVTGSNNCTDSNTVTITRQAMPVFAVSPGQSTCSGGKVQLTASGGTTYTWSPAQFLDDPALANPMATVPLSTLFQVIINDTVCSVSDTLFSNVATDLLPLPIRASKSNDIDCVFANATLSATGYSSFTWSPAAGLSATDIPNPVATPTATTLYTVSAADPVTNCKGSDTITIILKEKFGPKSFIPNAFTPNADGQNDCFRVMDFGTIKVAEVSVYNRWGTLVFHTTNAKDCWDGYYLGQPAEAGNYVYYIKVLNDCGEELKKGNLLLIR